MKGQTVVLGELVPHSAQKSDIFNKIKPGKWRFFPYNNITESSPRIVQNPGLFPLWLKYSSYKQKKKNKKKTGQWVPPRWVNRL
jgi:hypothetical protein